MTKKQRQQLSQLQKAFDQGILDETTYRAAVSALHGDSAKSAEVSGSGAVAQSGGVAAGAGGIAVGGDVVIVEGLSDLDALPAKLRNQLQRALRQQLQRTPESAEHLLALGLTYLDAGLYAECVDALQRALAVEPQNARILYYLALAGLHGRRPHSLRLFEVQAAERYLSASIHLDGGRAESLYLWALIKYDFYLGGGMLVSPPDIEDLLAMASRAAYDAVEIAKMLEHVPVPQSPVTDAMLTGNR
jgi:tetratricopeptide (TPR) repeat protein